MNADDCLDLTLLATSIAYAAWLKRHKEHEPHHTWLEVVAGVAYTLGYTAVALRLTPRDGMAVERRIWRSFLMSGLPVIAGEVEQAIRARAEFNNYRARVEEYFE